LLAAEVGTSQQRYVPLHELAVQGVIEGGGLLAADNLDHHLTPDTRQLTGTGAGHDGDGQQTVSLFMIQLCWIMKLPARGPIQPTPEHCQLTMIMI
jgi:hypothetical protein